MLRKPTLTLKHTLALGILVAGLAALIVLATRHSPSPPASAAAEQDELTITVTPAGCGTVAARQTHETTAPVPGSAWTFPAGAYVQTTATAVAGCTFQRWELNIGGYVFSDGSNPNPSS